MPFGIIKEEPVKKVQKTRDSNQKKKYTLRNDLDSDDLHYAFKILFGISIRKSNAEIIKLIKSNL